MKSNYALVYFDLKVIESYINILKMESYEKLF